MEFRFNGAFYKNGQLLHFLQKNLHVSAISELLLSKSYNLSKKRTRPFAIVVAVGFLNFYFCRSFSVRDSASNLTAIDVDGNSDGKETVLPFSFAVYATIPFNFYLFGKYQLVYFRTYIFLNSMRWQPRKITAYS